MFNDDLDSLLAALDDPNTPEAPKVHGQDHKHVALFISVKEIIESNHSIPDTYIYDSYVQWSKVRPLSKQKFFIQFRKYFKRRKGSKVYFYKVNPKSFGLPDDYSLYTDPFIFVNKSITSHNKYIGVYPEPTKAKNKKFKYVVRIKQENGSLRLVGKYRSALEAAEMYDKAMIQMYGKDVILNFPRKWFKNKDVKNGPDETQQD